MIAVLLTILKILGIVLLILLGILLLLLLLFLFVPVRYRLDAHRDLQEAEEKPIVALVKATWLLHLLCVGFDYPDAAYVKVKVFGITVYRSDRESKKKTGAQTEAAPAQTEKAPAQTENAPQKAEEVSAQAEEAPQKAEVIQAQAEEAPTQAEATPDQTKEASAKAEDVPDKTIKKQDEGESFGFFKKLFDFFRKLFASFRKLFEKIKNIKYTIRQIYDKINDIIKNIKYYLQVIQSDVFKNSFSLCSGQLFLLLKSIRPRKVKGRLLIGTGDPASTGQVLAIYGMLYPILGNHIEVIPDFEQQVIEGELLVKGRITLFRAIKTAFVLFFNKDIRRLINLLKREAK